MKLEGKEKLWRISPTPNDKFPKKIQELLLEERGIKPTNWKVHSNMYFHEKACSDIFVSLALTGSLIEWQGEGDQKAGFRHDRFFRVDERTFYLEMETGSQKLPAWRDKIIAYQKLYHATKKTFHVLFVMPDEERIEGIIKLFEEMKTGDHYRATTFEEFVADPATAQLTSRSNTIFLL